MSDIVICSCVYSNHAEATSVEHAQQRRYLEISDQGLLFPLMLVFFCINEKCMYTCSSLAGVLPFNVYYILLFHLRQIPDSFGDRTVSSALELWQKAGSPL